MSISARNVKRHLTGQIAWTVFLGFFAAVYESFSHGVYSPFMIFAFAVPLLLAVLPYALLLFKRADPGDAALGLWSAGAVTLSVGSVYQGVLEIYGTTHYLVAVYPAVAALLLAAGLIAGAVRLWGRR